MLEYHTYMLISLQIDTPIYDLKHIKNKEHATESTANWLWLVITNSHVETCFNPHSWNVPADYISLLIHVRALSILGQLSRPVWADYPLMVICWRWLALNRITHFLITTIKSSPIHRISLASHWIKYPEDGNGNVSRKQHANKFMCQ